MRGDIIITEVENPGESTAYKVSGMVQGKRRRQNFKTQAEALNAKQNWELENAKMAPRNAVMAHLTEPQAREAEAVFQRLTGSPHSLTFCADYTLRNFKPAVNSVLLSVAITEFRAEQKTEAMRPDTLNNLRFRLAAFLNFTGDRPADEVTPEQVRAFVFRVTDPPRAARSIVNDRLVLSNFFNWCLNIKKYVSVNPVASVKPPKIRGRKAPKTLTLAQSRLLMAAALKHKEGIAVPYFALCLFGGMRPREVSRLSWDLLNLDKLKRVDCNDDVAKTGEHRFISLTPNMLEWLLPHALKRTPLDIGRADFDKVRECLGGYWPPDVLRHTCVSNFLPEHTDREATDRHGHSISVMLKHYRDRVTLEDSKEFWNITPASCDNITLLEQKAA